MNKIKCFSIVILSLLSLPSFAALPDLEANSLIRCEEAASVSDAVSDLNGTLASPFLKIATGLGNFYKIENFVSSQPIITRLDNGKVSVCVTLTRKK